MREFVSKLDYSCFYGLLAIYFLRSNNFSHFSRFFRKSKNFNVQAKLICFF